MRRKLPALWRYRPRVLTLLLLCSIGGLLVLANLSQDVSFRRMNPEIWQPKLVFDLQEPRPDSNAYGNGTVVWVPVNLTSGWPLAWRQSVQALCIGPTVDAGRCYSPARLAANVVLWLALLAIPMVACECLLRRYRQRFCWNLRTMLAAVAVIAAGCGWFAFARNRAIAQDPVIEPGGWYTKSVLLEQWGPKWLKVIGADRYCRRVMGVELSTDATDPTEQPDHDWLLRLKRLPDLQYLFCAMDPALPEALTELRQLRVLSVEGLSWEYDQQTSQKLLAAIGKLAQLEHLQLKWMKIDGPSLSCLAGLHNLKSLSLDGLSTAGAESGAGPTVLSSMPVLPRLRALDPNAYEVGDRDLHYLSAFPGLQSLNLDFAEVTGDGLSQLASLPALEELTLNGKALSAAGLEALSAAKRLKKLHVIASHGPLSPPTYLTLDDGAKLHVPESELDRSGRAFGALRQSHPGIVIDSDYDALDWHEDKKVLSQYAFPYPSVLNAAPPVTFWNCWQWRKERR
jgi:hypothetical protein